MIDLASSHVGVAALCLWATLGGCQRYSPKPGGSGPPEAERTVVRGRLRAMVARDQHARRNNLRWADVDRDHTAELKQLIRRYGWPRVSVWGADADRDAWLLAQHSPDLDFQREVLALLDRLRRDGETRAQNYAFLFDRVALTEIHTNGTAYLTGEGGRRQRYGTQGNCVGTRWEPFPVEDPANLEARRAAVGLQPLEEYRKLFHCP